MPIITTLFGPPLAARLPGVSPWADCATQFDDLLESLRGAPVVLFEALALGRLDDMFRLRLAQILRDEPALPALSVVVLTQDTDAAPLAGGFAARFRCAWPFARCVFMAADADTASAQAALGLPVSQLGARPPEILHADTPPRQPIALQIQPLLGRCGSTTAFQNQVEALVGAGHFTLRLLSDVRGRRGATLTATAHRLMPENNRDAGAHVEVVAVPRGPYPPPPAGEAVWAEILSEEATCDVDDSAIRAGAQRADTVIANHIFRVGLALRLAPRAKLLLDVHDDHASAFRQMALMQGGSAADAAKAADEAAKAQVAVLPIADLCSHVSVSEMEALAPLCRQTAIVLPRPYVRGTSPLAEPRYDILLVGDQHPFNVDSLTWFLAEVWRLRLAPSGFRAAVAGRAGQRIDPVLRDLPGLDVLGFVPDLEALRAACRMTVVPDRGGSGLPIKTLTTLFAGHPLSSTSTGLRGLDPAISGLLPATDDAAALAADIIGVLSSQDNLAARAALVRRVRAAIDTTLGYAECLASLAAPSESRQRERLEQWHAAIAPALRRRPEPFRLAPGAVFPMSGTPWDDQVLLEGWHLAEDWGRWMDGGEATAVLTLTQPAAEPLRLELDPVLPGAAASLSIALDQTHLATIDPAVGLAEVPIPLRLLEGRTCLPLRFHASAVVCPAENGDSADMRVLGVGFCSLRLIEGPLGALAVGRTARLTNRQSAPGLLLQSGWHRLEDWGCWTSRAEACARLDFDRPLLGPMQLDVDLAASPVHQPLTLEVNGHTLPPRIPVPGHNTWPLPPPATEGSRTLLLKLHVPETVCPAQRGASRDERRLGVGVQAITVRPLETISLNARHPVSPSMLAAGWHTLEPWGCWSKGSEAILIVRPETPLVPPCRLELNLAPPLVDQPVTLSVNGTPLASEPVRNGFNQWPLPAACITAQRDLRITLRIIHPARPADIRDSNDGRILGIGIRSVGIFTN